MPVTAWEVFGVKIVVIDGQGGRMGLAIVHEIKTRKIRARVMAIGTNSAATAAMLSGGADSGATGENALMVAVRGADYIIGPLGILVPDALLGEISPAMARAVGQSPGKKILLPISKCGCMVAGVRELPFGELVRLAIELLAADNRQM